MRKPKGTPTASNLHALWRHFEGRDVAPARVESVRFNSLKRCLDAGLVVGTADGKSLVLTDAGKAEVRKLTCVTDGCTGLATSIDPWSGARCPDCFVTLKAKWDAHLAQQKSPGRVGSTWQA